MTLYQKSLDNLLVVSQSSSSPGTGWSAVSNLQTAINNARSSAKPLQLLPGVYLTSQILVDTASGGGNRLELFAEQGTVTVRLSAAAPYLLNVNNVPDVVVRGINFDGSNQTINGSGIAGLIRFDGSSTTDFIFSECNVSKSMATGVVAVNNARGRIADNRISNCGIGIFAIDSQVFIENNGLSTLNDNGICVWASTVGGNGSVVSGNTVNWVDNASGGTGQYGNGILVYRAGNVKISENNVFNTKFSAIRLNAANNGHVVNNYCWNMREVAIFIEAPGAGENLSGGIISGNNIDTAGLGISVANSGLYGDGIADRCVVSNNNIINITNNAIPYPDGSTSLTTGRGITVETDTIVTNNVISLTVGAAIGLGVNDAAKDIMATGNLINNCPMGIAYSTNNSASSILVSSNVVRGYRDISNVADPNYPISGAIVSYSFDGSSFQRDKNGGSPNTDYGNATQTSSGPLTVGMNRANP
ncbi:TIGR03808 family TAT-translocated repetitive protein [Rhizobium sp. BR 315]|uniref:TIGR03808 family TAT-translocated repetitive protein n=1 Tax=Rhizobium sp. BR 315 TaxID=3040014 RepID=UPI003D34CE03